MFGTHHANDLPAAGADNLRFAVSMTLDLMLVEILNSPRDSECGDSLETLAKVLDYFVEFGYFCPILDGPRNCLPCFQIQRLLRSQA